MFSWENGLCVLNLSLQINLIVEGIDILRTALIEWYYYFYYHYPLLLSVARD